jgi:hypothetical protein
MTDNTDKSEMAHDPVASSFSEIATLLAEAKSDAMAPIGLTAPSPVNKITWAQIGRVEEPGRHKLNFGWLIVTDEDLVVWRAFPNAAFTLFRTVTAAEVEEEFRLGTFELRENLSLSEK